MSSVGDMEFESWLGRPHPLLLEEVFAVVLGYVDVEGQRTCRLVCNTWKECVDRLMMGRMTLQHAATRVTAPYPDGFAPYPVPRFTRLIVNDPCEVLNSMAFQDYMEEAGPTLTYFGMEANFQCADQVDFLRRFLTRWSSASLQELELFGVGSLDFLRFNSGISLLEDNVRLLSLKKFAVHGAGFGEQYLLHRHYTSRPPCQGSPRRDYTQTGLIFEIISCSPVLESIKLSLPTICLMRFVEGAIAIRSSVRELELENGAVGLLDVREMGRSDWFSNLRRLVLGRVSYRASNADLGILFRSLHRTLEELELGLEPYVGPRPVIGTLTLCVGRLQLLRKLVIRDASRLRVGGLLACQRLEELIIQCEPVIRLHWNAVSQHVATMMYTAGRRLQNLHTIAFHSACPGIRMDHGMIVDALLPHSSLRNCSVECGHSDWRSVVFSYGRLHGLERLSLRIIQGNGSDEFRTNYMPIRLGAGLRSLKLTNYSTRHLRLSRTDLLLLLEGVHLYSLDLAGFTLCTDDGARMARLISRRVNSVNFTNCRLNSDEGWASGLQGRVLDGVELTRLNHGMLIRDLFH